MKMTLEQMDHFLRHIKIHAEEVRNGSFNKDEAYIYKLREAQYMALEISHDMVHVMREKLYKGYENADFQFVISLPENWEKHEFRTFDYSSFRIGINLKETIDLGMIPERAIPLECKSAEEQMECLAKAVQDAEVLIAMLKPIFGIGDLGGFRPI